MEVSAETVRSSTVTQRSSLTPASTRLLQRKCACGGTGANGECDGCKQEGVLDGHAKGPDTFDSIPPSVHALNPAARSSFDFGLSYDFTRIPAYAKAPVKIQTTLTVNTPGDVYEQEADRISGQVLASPAHPAVGGAPPHIQRFSGQSNGQMDAVPTSVNQALASPGRPLEPALRQDMEQRFGHDFSRVRVHADTSAAESAQTLSARAYTVGGDIIFAQGQYVPGTSEGKRLLAHELTHVVQQSDRDDIPVGLDDVIHSPSFSGHHTVGTADEVVKRMPRRPATPSAVALQRNWEDDLTDKRAHDLNEYVAQNPKPYKHVIEVIHFSEREQLDDNVAAAFTELQSAAKLEQFAATEEGRDMLDVLYNAMMTGNVTQFETLQSDRILYANWKWMPSEVLRTAQLRDPEVEASLAERPVDLEASKIAQDLNDDVAKNHYRDVILKFSELDSFIEDNVASHLMVLQSPDKLEKFAGNKEGRAMLDVLYAALITGRVTGFERLQTERILAAEAKTIRVPTGAALTKAINDPAIFPLATGWSSTATIVAELLPNGKVKVFYDTYTGAKQPKFRRELETLLRHYGESAVFNGIILEPDELVVVKLYDQGEVIVPVPAIELIDFFNQQKEDTLGKIRTVSYLGATVGLGGIGAGGILGWADTITFAISTASLFVNAYRDVIAKTANGRRFLEAWDFAEQFAEYYNWGRLGFDGLRLIHGKVSPAFGSWRQETPTGLNSVERETIAKAQQQTEAWLDAVKKAESAEAAKYLEAHPPKKIEGKAGHRHADIEGGHAVEEVSGGLGCELYSPGGTPVRCPHEFEHTEPSKTEEPVKPPKGAEKPVPTEKSRLSEKENAKREALEKEREVLLERAKAISEDLEENGKRLRELNRQEREQGSSAERKKSIEKVRREIRENQTHKENNKAALERNNAEIAEARKPFFKRVSDAVDRDSDYKDFRTKAQKERVDKVSNRHLEKGESIDVDHLVSRDEAVKKPGVDRLDPKIVASILNDEENLIPIESRANKSKGNRSWSATTGSDRAVWSQAESYYTKGDITKMATKENSVRVKIMGKLDDEIAKLPKGR